MQFNIIGGDNRFEILEKMLTESGHTVSKNARVFILPLPVSRDGITVNAPRQNDKILLSDIIQNTEEGDIYFGGLIPEDFALKLRATGAVVFDYNACEEFARLNAVPTAEGALALAIESTDYSLRGAKCLVSGYGKIGKVLAQYLSALGADVTISARKEADFSAANQLGLKHIHCNEITLHIADYPLIFNTVPHRIFTDEAISAMSSGCLYIELASAPYGIDFDCASAAGITLINAPSLPAKVAPVTAAKNIKNTIFHIIREEFT